MTVVASVWLIIASALAMANLPFLLDRPLAFWPWTRRQAMPVTLRWAGFFGYAIGLALWVLLTFQLLGGAFAGGAGQVAVFLVKLLICAVLVAVLMILPGWRQASTSDLASSASGASQPARAEPATRSATEPAGASAPARGDVSMRRHAVMMASRAKPFWDRVLEVLVGYVIVGTLGLSLELNQGNAFPKQWEFYAVTLALFLVLAYPGFVWRYLMKRRRPR